MVGKDSFGAATLQSKATAPAPNIFCAASLFIQQQNARYRTWYRAFCSLHPMFLFVFSAFANLFYADNAHSRQKNMPFTGRAGAKTAGKEPTSDSFPIKGQLSVEPIEKLW